MPPQQLSNTAHPARLFGRQHADCPVATRFREQLSQKAGLLVVGVESGSPADEAGVVMGDTLVAVANQSIGNHHDLLAQLSAERIGEKRRLRSSAVANCSHQCRHRRTRLRFKIL